MGGGTATPASKGKTVAASGVWGAATIAEYRAWISQQAFWQAISLTEKFDCADFAIAMLFRFAKTRNLPIVLSRVGAMMSTYDRTVLGMSILRGKAGAIGGGMCDDAKVSEDSFVNGMFHLHTGHDVGETEARQSIGASHVFDLTTGNCTPVASIEELEPGDLIVSKSHVQVAPAGRAGIEAPGSGESSPSPKSVIEIVQGNVPPVVPQYRAWDLDRGARYEYSDGSWKYLDDQSLRAKWGTTYVGRRWNFARFNAWKSVACGR